MYVQYLNLACGVLYVNSKEWVNCDFSPSSKDVTKVDLNAKLPYESDFFDLVYSSHFIEHISREKVEYFLYECHRVLKPGGIIRIVTPDFENIVSEYLLNISKKRYLFSEFNVTELIDQCVRVKPGGELARWYEFSKEDYELRNYIFGRIGHKASSSEVVQNKKVFFSQFFFRKVLFRLSFCYSRILVLLLPKWFKSNHVSLTSTGEKHLWVYDVYQLSKLFSKVGFSQIEKQCHNKSKVLDFNRFNLDTDELGNSRKGQSSLYLEGKKLISN
jgi:predicted SAM-dependent methyltransferase